MKKMFFFMNVDIRWIKQRPHFLATELCQFYDITVFYPYFYNRNVLCEEEKYPFLSRRIIRVPNVIKSKIVHTLVDSFSENIIQGWIKKESPDYVFLCAPEQIRFIPNNYEGKIIYDCMDDLIALASNDMVRQKVYNNERVIVEKAHLISVSSNELLHIMKKRYSLSIVSKCNLIRNAYNGKIYDNESGTQISEGINKPYRICYFGTISSWFNFEYMIKSIEQNNNIEYWLIGPVIDGVKIPNNQLIKYFGVVKHDMLNDYVGKCDAFVMPFILNEIVKSVDPVKLYEYINYGKPIICVKYEEILRFGEFVNFYNSYEEFVEQIKIVSSRKMVKYTDEKRRLFLENNTWRCRAEQIKSILGD